MIGGKLQAVRFAARIALGVSMLLLCVPSRANAQTLTELRVATTPTDTGAQVYYALDLGLFKKNGLDVHVSSINAGSAVATAVAGGSFDIAQTSITALASAHEHGLPFVIIAPGGAYSSKAPTSELVVPATSAIRSASDLAGKTIAVNGIKSITQIAVEAWIDQNGGKSADSKYYEIPFAQMSAALTAGRADAAFIAEPSLAKALEGGAKVIGHAYDAVGSDFLISAWFCTTGYAKAHPDIVQRFSSAIAEASRWANDHQDESAKILEKYTKTQVTSKIVRVTYVDRLIARQVQPLIDASAKYGALAKSFPATELFASTGTDVRH
ncbi:MAG TPA: ABC transporter substrate-binding protein [Candidatus Lustribacter sp.]